MTARKRERWSVGWWKKFGRKSIISPSWSSSWVNEERAVIGYAMFSGFHLEGKYEEELLILTPVAVKTQLQRQHISKELIEYGFEKAKKLGYQAVLVEGNPKNYASRGFRPSYTVGIEAGPKIKLPHPDCLMVKELEEGALKKISGWVDFSSWQ